MESGLDLYYPGNTVIPPHPGMRRKMKIMRQDDYVHTDKNMDHIPKTVATSSCVWCNTVFGQYLTVCLCCRNCQYCGLYVAPGFGQDCPTCQNHPDEQITTDPAVIRAE